MSLEKAFYWPAWLMNSLSIKNKKTSEIKYGHGQIYLWRALNLYDDFLDGGGRATDLPRANNYFRRFLKIFYASNLPTAAYRDLESLLIDLEKYNRAEAQQSLIISGNQGWHLPRRLPDFSNISCLSRKSLALAIMPLCCLWKINPALAGKHQAGLISFFRFALAAKQLADDAADWKEDLDEKKITPVTIALLRAAEAKKICLDPEKRPEEAHLIFAFLVSQKIARAILSLCRQARQEAWKCGLKSNAPIIAGLLEQLEKTSRNALANYRRYQKKINQS